MNLYIAYIPSYIEPRYVKYKKLGKTTWECKHTIQGIEKTTYNEAVLTCNANSKCVMIEQDDCKNEFKLCTSTEVEDSSDDCIYKKVYKKG